MLFFRGVAATVIRESVGCGGGLAVFDDGWPNKIFQGQWRTPMTHVAN